MKKATIFFVLFFILTMSACEQSNKNNISSTMMTSSQISNVSLYESFLDELQLEQKDLYYCVKDIDGNNVSELIILENTELTIYTFNNSVEKIGEHDFITGTVRFFYSNNPNYPGIFYFTAGGGANHYGYMSIENNELYFENLFEENYSINTTEDIQINELSSNKHLISEAKSLYNSNNDIHFKNLER